MCSHRKQKPTKKTIEYALNLTWKNFCLGWVSIRSRPELQNQQYNIKTNCKQILRISRLERLGLQVFCLLSNWRKLKENADHLRVVKQLLLKLICMYVLVLRTKKLTTKSAMECTLNFTSNNFYSGSFSYHKRKNWMRTTLDSSNTIRKRPELQNQ